MHHTHIDQNSDLEAYSFVIINRDYCVVIMVELDQMVAINITILVGPNDLDLHISHIHD